MDEKILQLGAIAVIFLFAIKEFFAWFKSRNGEKNGNDKLLTIISNNIQEERAKTDLKIKNLNDKLVNLKDNDLHTLTENQKEIKLLQIKHCEMIAELKTLIKHIIPK